MHVTVSERGVTWRILGDLSGLPPSAFDSSASLHGAEMLLEFFDASSGRPSTLALLSSRLVAGGHRELEIVATSAEAVPAMRRIATRLEERLPDWPSSEEAFSGLSLVEAGSFYGRAGGRGYRTVTPLSGDPDRHGDQALLLALELARRHDPSRTVRFHRSSRRERDLVVGPGTPPAEFLRGAAGAMRVAPEYTPAACQQVICVDGGGLSAHLHLAGPSYAFVARGPRDWATSVAAEAIALFPGGGDLHPEVAEMGRLLGLPR